MSASPAARPCLLVACGAAGGCVTSTVQEIREADTGMDDGESIVVWAGAPCRLVPKPSSASCPASARTCAAAAGASPSSTRTPSATPLFPWFEPRTAPANAPRPARDHPSRTCGERLESWGCVTWCGSKAIPTAPTPAARSPAASPPPGAGCFGFLTWENDSSYEASVWDIRNGTSCRPHQQRCRGHQLHAGGDRAPALHRPGALLSLQQPGGSAEELSDRRGLTGPQRLLLPLTLWLCVLAPDLDLGLGLGPNLHDLAGEVLRLGGVPLLQLHVVLLARQIAELVEGGRPGSVMMTRLTPHRGRATRRLSGLTILSQKQMSEATTTSKRLSCSSLSFSKRDTSGSTSRRSAPPAHPGTERPPCRCRAQ
jgi:hypothetical protein